MSTVDNSHVIIVLDDSNYDKDGFCVVVPKIESFS